MFPYLFLATTAFGLVTIFIYTLIVIMLVTYWEEFKNSFFQLYIADYFINLTTFLNSYITLKVPSNTSQDGDFSLFFKDNSKDGLGNFPLFIFANLHYHMAFVQSAMILTIATNRFSMIYMPFRNELIWKKYFPLIIASVVLAPFAFTWPLAINKAYYVYNNVTDKYQTKSEADTGSIITCILVFLIFSCGLTAIINVLSFLKLYCMKLKPAVSTAERHLVLVSFANFIIQLVGAVVTVLLRIDESRTTAVGQVAQYILPFISDTISLSQPWLLILLSSKIRQSIIMLYKRIKRNAVAPTPPNNSNVFQNSRAGNL